MADKDLQKLPPEERIKKLKELEAQRKKEIEDAQKQIKESEQELTDRREWLEKVPIPELASEELEGLSAEGRELLKTQRGLKERKKAAETPAPKPAAKPSLEETVGREELREVPPEILQADYTRHLSQTPLQDLYGSMGRIRDEIAEKGYMSSADERRVEYTMGAIERKREEGYDFTEDLERMANLTQQVGMSLRRMYQAGQQREYQT